MNYNLHTHTKRCGHATGEDEEYVSFAIEGGVELLGFSDHAPFLFPDGKQQQHCVQVEATEDYFGSLGSLRKKYRDRIDIRIGFEMEYYPAYFGDMAKYVKSLGAEYLVLGQHAIYNGKLFIHGISGSEENFKEYIRCTIEAMSTGCFTQVAHPDMMQLSCNDALYESEVRRLATVSRELNIPLEINLLGVRDGRCYPLEKFWRIVGEEGAPVTVGMDAHSPDVMLNKSAFHVAEWLIKKHRLNYVGAAEIRCIKN